MNRASVGVFLLSAWLVVSGCGEMPGRAVTVTAMARSVDSMAESADRIGRLATGICRAAENRASDLPDLEQAKAKLTRVRSLCDVVFAALRATDEAVKAADSAAKRAQFDAVEIAPEVEKLQRAQVALLYSWSALQSQIEGLL